MDQGPSMATVEQVVSDMQGLSIGGRAAAGRVLLFHPSRPSSSSLERPHFPDLKASCPGLLSFEMIPDSCPLVAILTFEDWDAAAKAVVGLWKLRLEHIHYLTPELPDEGSNVALLRSRLNKDLKNLFLGHLASLETGEDVQQCRLELEDLKNKLISVTKSLKRSNPIAKWAELSAEKHDVLMQIHVLAGQLAEYVNGLKSLELALLSRCSEWAVGSNDQCTEETLLLRLGKDWTWHQVHCLVERETYRFKERLPLYAKRSDILRQVHSNQVVVLNGETGSGKSTQLVQYLVDAGFVEDGSSVVCTQPRRVAVLTLSERVAVEVKGCNGPETIVGHLTSPALRTQQWQKIMYMTDYTLLQLCLLDEKLMQFGCIIVDEAHERSLNTDLLLALLKKCLLQRPDMKLIIMSATADTALLSSYFGGCIMYQVQGRSFPIQYIYEPDDSSYEDLETRQGRPANTRHVLRVVHVVASINAGPDKGDVLAFLTSQAEVEWACSQDYGHSALVLALHGKLQAEEQRLVFKETPHGMRKIVFATNIAETSLTIPGIKFVVDCGLAKESFMDPKSGMNVLKVCKIDRSAAMQRAGRAGRTQAGICYRLYRIEDFDSMAAFRIPEIKRVHLGVVVLKLLALGVQEVESFDFIDCPDPEAIWMAFENLYQLGAVVLRDGTRHLTPLGWQLVKLGGDPRLSFIVLRSISEGLGKEGIVIASLLSCSGSVFFRAGSDEEKLRSDCLKMRFCHHYGDIFTLISVYQEWDSLPEHKRNRWCFENSINAKSMRRCRDIVNEMERCLKVELHVEVSPFWTWSAATSEEHSIKLRKILLAAMSGNLAVFSGHDSLGYDVLSYGKQAFLHPSSSLLVFGRSPTWVVFGELLCTTRQFLVSVTVVEPEWLSEIQPPLPYNIPEIVSSRMNCITLPNLSKCLLSRLCGRSNRGLKVLTKRIQQGGDQHCILEADFDMGRFHIYATMDLIGRAEMLVKEVIQQEERLLNNETIQKCLFQAAPGKGSPVMLFTAGAEIKELLMPGEFVSVEISNVDTVIEDHTILDLFHKCADGITGFRRDLSSESSKKWGTITYFSTKGAAEAISLLNGTKVGRCCIQVQPAIMSSSSDRSGGYFPAVRAVLTWPRRQLKGHAIVRCAPEDEDLVIRSVSGMLIGGGRVLCKRDRKGQDGRIFIHGLGTQISETELEQTLHRAAGCNFVDVFMPRFCAIGQPSLQACRESLVKEIEHFVPVGKFQVLLPTGHGTDYACKAVVRFDESVHEGAAQAIEHLQGSYLPLCKSWQKISCLRTFSSSVQCPKAVYNVLKEDIADLILALQQQNKGAELHLNKLENGGCHVKVLASSLRTVAGCKSALEKLIEGMVVADESLDDSVLRLLFFTRDGLQIAKSVELQTRTHIFCDKRNRIVKIFGPTERKTRALKKLVRSLLQLQERKKCYEISLRGGGWPSGLMREIVRLYGPDLSDLKMLVEGASLNLDQRRHTLLVRGSKEEAFKVERKVEEIAGVLKGSQCSTLLNSENCGICLCEIEDQYSLVGCGHKFCRACVEGQILSAVRHRDGFPLTCTHKECSQCLLISDFEMLLTPDQLDELQKASLSAFVALNRGKYNFCMTPDCPAVYRVSEKGELFACGACSVRTCTSCHVEYHLGLTCEQYKEFKQDPDLSLKAWRKGKEHVKCCPACGSTIEKVDGCNHVLCNCKAHLCWLCLSSFKSSEDCYSHLQNLHGGFV